MKLFISYAHDDKGRVKELARLLERGGHEAWFDRGLLPGQRWENVLKEQVESCETFIYVISRDSLKSDWCKREHRMAKKAKLDIIPILFDKKAEPDIPPDLKKIQHIDLADGFDMDQMLHLSAGLKAIEKKLVDQRARKEQLAEIQKHGSKRGMTSSQFDNAIAPMAVQLLKLKGTEEKYIRNLKEQVNEHIEAKRWDKALNKVNEVFEVEDNSAENYSIRGRLYAELGDVAKMLADNNEAIRLDPQLVFAYVNRGYAHIKLGEQTKALADVNEAIRLDPQLVIAYLNRGYVYTKLGEHSKALADVNEAIRLDPHSVGAYHNRCFILYLMGHIEAALEDAEKICEFEPNVFQSYNSKAFLLFQLKRYEDAKVAWQKAAGFKGAESYAWAGYAITLEQFKHPAAAAEKQYRKAVNLDKRWKNDLEAIAKEYLWTEAMIELARGREYISGFAKPFR